MACASPSDLRINRQKAAGETLPLFLLSVRRQARKTTAPHCRQRQQQSPDVIGVADPARRVIAARIRRCDLKC
ncbi:MAG: hypothetical protein EBT34_02320 [Acetobacteraceae bacterium]|nr:hypothetical protein [Acetobacteraceae bacterium]NBS42570.1 hypothetical protein [Acetobacteraceae bacterium]